MADVDSVIQGSVVTGDLHVGDVYHNTQNTHLDQSTNFDLPSIEEVGKKVASAASIVGQQCYTDTRTMGKEILFVRTGDSTIPQSPKAQFAYISHHFGRD